MRTHHGIRGARDPGLDGAPRLQVGPAAPKPMAMGGSEMDHSIPWEMDAIKLGPSEYFVIGDNRAASIFCTVRKKDILGKTVF